jgi:hypothetical protein
MTESDAKNDTRGNKRMIANIARVSNNKEAHLVAMVQRHLQLEHTDGVVVQTDAS